MLLQRTIACCMVFMITSAVTLAGQAAVLQDNSKEVAQEKPKNVQKKKSQAPIVVEGDKLYFNDQTGEVYAQGDVKITQDIETILSQYMRGNTKTTELWIDDQATFLQPGTKLVGTKTHYNYGDKTGTMQDIKGKVGNQIIAGENLEMVADKLLLQDGTMTKCPAKVPDYHISADRLEIWPGDKYIAYNAKFWIKNTVIYSVSKYQGSLKNDGQSEFPVIGYDSDDGVFIKQHLEYPVSDKLALQANIDWYSRAGYRPSYGIINRENSYSIGLTQGHFHDDSGNWIKKEPEWRFDLYSRRLGNGPVSYSFSAVYGKWIDKTKTSWHQDYSIYFSREPIELSKSMNLYLGTGWEHIRESYDGSQINSLKFDATVTKKISDRWNTSIGYHYTKTNNSLFDYGRADLGRELDFNLSYQMDKMNTIAFKQSYDLSNNRIYDQDYVWYRDLHCWQAKLEYRAKRNQFNVSITTKRW